jgi:hypothetical protein
MQNCLICSENGNVVAKALVAPFISSLAFNNVSISSTLIECSSCDFVFFSHRYAEREMEKIYSNYRGSTYTKIRKNWEPWYTEDFNDALNPGTDAVIQRVQFMERIISTIPSFESRIKTIVDVGGDAGQFFPINFAGNKFLLDVSDKEVVSGVKRVSSLSEVTQEVDLLIAAHLLEHLPDPNLFIMQIVDGIPIDSYLYLEVPLDRPKYGKFMNSSLYESYLNFLIKHKFLFTFIDLISGIARNYNMIIPFFQLTKQSEHINYFSSSSLKVLLNRNKLEILAIESDFSSRLKLIKFGKIGVLAKKVI